MPQIKDITGQRFNRLTVVAYLGQNKRHISTWWCICDCGKEIIAIANRLKIGDTKSCGCLQQEVRRMNGKNNGIKHIPPAASDLQSGVGTAQIYRRYKYSARLRELHFDLTLDQFDKLIRGKCYYCGRPPSNTINRVAGNSGFMYNGVDRMNSSVGYDPENCVSCCKICNYAKRNMDIDEFINWIYDAHRHLSQYDMDDE